MNETLLQISIRQGLLYNKITRFFLFMEMSFIQSLIPQFYLFYHFTGGAATDKTQNITKNRVKNWAVC